jgi:hypothetical protein
MAVDHVTGRALDLRPTRGARQVGAFHRKHVGDDLAGPAPRGLGLKLQHRGDPLEDGSDLGDRGAGLDGDALQAGGPFEDQGGDERGLLRHGSDVS